MADAPKKEIQLFYCYAREDKALRDELEINLSGLKRQYRLTNWSDREILPGEPWEQAIDTHLDMSDVILLLISPHFLASEYCYGKEMQHALERHREGTCCVIPILLRPTYWEDTPFSDIQVLPTDAKPITSWTDRYEAFHDVVKGIGSALKSLLISRKTKEDWLEEARTLKGRKRYEEALAACEQAIQRDPRYIEAYLEMGTTLHTLKRYEEALESFGQAIRLDAKFITSYIAKGQTLSALGRYNEALAGFEQAIAIEPNLDAYIGRDKILQQLGISKEAQEQLEGALRLTREELAVFQEQYGQLDQELRQTRQQLADSQRLYELKMVDLKQTKSDLEKSNKARRQLEGELKQTRQQLPEQRGTDQFRKSSSSLEYCSLGHANPPGSTFCDECGEPLPAVKG